MLWYKSWLETRWRFLIGLAILMFSAAGTVITYPQVLKLLPLAPRLDLGGELGRRVAESIEMARDYRSYVWSQWFRENLAQSWTLFAVMLGTGGLLSQAARGGGALFTLSLPATRNRLLAVRGATALVELLALALLPSLLIPLLSPGIAQSYGVLDALVHGLCAFVAGATFFSLSFLLSTVFGDVWRPALIAIGIATTLSLCEQFLRDAWPLGLFRVMSAESYFRGAGVPWLGLGACLLVSAALLYAASRNIARQDF